MTRTGLDQLWLDRHGRTARSTDFTICPALGSAHPFAPRHLNTRLLKPMKWSTQFDNPDEITKKT